MIAYSIVEGSGIERPGEDSCVTILTLSWMKPVVVGHNGETKEAREMELHLMWY
jgi:hypothetical protein